MNRVEEAQYWRDKVHGAARGQLETVQKTATAWSALLTSLIGAFSVVAFAGGLKTIDDLETWPMRIAKTLTVIAALCLLIATYKASQASGRISVEYSSNTAWDSYRDKTITAANEAAKKLSTAKKWGAVAAIAALGGSLFVFLVSEPESLGPMVIVNGGDAVVCGRMTRDVNGQIVVEDTVIKSVESLTVVSACPEQP